MAPSPLGLYDTSAEEQEDERRHVLVPPVVGDSPHLDAVDTGARHYPRCLVWCNLGLLTCFFPLVGHCGISTSKGVITDFAGPYFIHTSKHSLAFGSPVKYLQLDLGKVPGGLERYDSVVEQVSHPCVYGAPLLARSSRDPPLIGWPAPLQGCQPFPTETAQCIHE